MNPVKYIDYKYQELTVEAQEGFSIFRDAEQTSLQFVLAIIRLVLKFYFVPKVILDYFLTLTNRKSKPQPKLEQLKAAHQESQKIIEEVTKKAKRR